MLVDFGLFVCRLQSCDISYLSTRPRGGRHQSQLAREMASAVEADILRRSDTGGMQAEFHGGLTDFILGLWLCLLGMANKGPILYLSAVMCDPGWCGHH